MEWRTLSSEAAGTSHILRGLPCQDRTYTLTSSGVTAIALADGAGSRRYSEMGAECASREICRLLCKEFDTLFSSATPYILKTSIINRISSKLGEVSLRHRVSKDDLACTLLAAAVRGSDYITFHIGDGVIGYRKDGHLHVASHPYNGAGTNETVFITSPATLRHTSVRKGTQELLEGFILMSDGSERSLYSRKSGRLSRSVETIMQRCELYGRDHAERELSRILCEELIPRTHDDCSLAVMTRKRGSFGFWERIPLEKRAAILGISTSSKAKRRRSVKKYSASYGIAPNPQSTL